MSGIRWDIQIWPIGRLRPYERNPRKNDHVVSLMEGSIREFGFKLPVLARSSGEIVDGHLRLKAAMNLGLKELPVILCDEWTPAQVKAFRLLVNKSVEWADWDSDLLKLEMSELKELDFDLTLTGFDLSEVDGLLDGSWEPASRDSLKPKDEPDPNPAEDDVPPGPEAPVSQPGDLWLMGEHRLLCGDSTKAEDVARVLGERKPLLMVTDPPYGVDYDPDWRNDAAQAGANSMGAPGGRAIGRVSNDDRDDWSDAWRLFPGAVAYVWHSAIHCVNVARSLEHTHFVLRAQIIWAKSHLAISRGHYHWQHEPCWYGVRKGRTANWLGDRSQSTCWSVPKPQASETGHSTQKPVEIMRRPILNHTVPGDAVYDPFLGSGSTLVAADLTGRVCYGLEIEPAYCDVIVTRWQNLTGKTATLGDGSHKGATFEQVKFGRRLGAQDELKEEALSSRGR